MNILYLFRHSCGESKCRTGTCLNTLVFPYYSRAKGSLSLSQFRQSRRQVFGYYKPCSFICCIIIGNITAQRCLHFHSSSRNCLFRVCDRYRISDRKAAVFICHQLLYYGGLQYWFLSFSFCVNLRFGLLDLHKLSLYVNFLLPPNHSIPLVAVFQSNYCCHGQLLTIFHLCNYIISLCIRCLPKIHILATDSADPAPYVLILKGFYFSLLSTLLRSSLKLLLLGICLSGRNRLHTNHIRKHAHRLSREDHRQCQQQRQHFLPYLSFTHFGSPFLNKPEIHFRNHCF